MSASEKTKAKTKVKPRKKAAKSKKTSKAKKITGDIELTCFINMSGNIRFDKHVTKPLKLDKFVAVKFAMDEETNEWCMILRKKKDDDTFKLSKIYSHYIVYCKELFERYMPDISYRKFKYTYRLTSELDESIRMRVVRFTQISKEKRTHTVIPAGRKKTEQKED